MRELLFEVTEISVLVIDAIALFTIVAGTLGAVFQAVRLLFAQGSGHERRAVWLRYSRWLIAGLTFQLAADIIESSITTSWDAVGRLAAIAVIRTFLNYFLERDIAEVRERDDKSKVEAST